VNSDGLTQLAGVRVVDFTQALSGPYGTMMLADLGADVVKVENVSRGDDSRHWGPPFLGSDAAYFMSVNRNKRSVALDLKDADDRAAAISLVMDADVVVENWRPGTAQRLGLGPDHLRELNPRLVYCSISGYGQDQPPRPGYDQIVQGTSGVMPMTGPADRPTKWGVPIGDIAAGMFAASAITAVLFERERTGVGRFIDVAMQDCLVSMLTHHAARYLATGVVPPSDDNGHATIAPYGAFRASDGYVNVCVGNDSQFARFCDALGRPDIAADAQFASNPLRVANKDRLLAALEPVLASLTVTEVIEALERAGVPVGPVRDIAGALDDRATAEREMILAFSRDDSGTARVTNTPWKINGTAPTVRLAPPKLGEHQTELLAGLPTRAE
jgi:formyl-CoA transferase